MRFYQSLISLQSNPPSYGDPFIVQWVIPDPTGEQERKYIVFDGVNEYLRHFIKGRYRTCHEVFISIGMKDVTGHPAFDIDMEDPDLPSSWQENLISNINTAMNILFPGIDIDVVPVWMTSKNPTKLSKHLTIRNVVFTSWAEQMKSLVKIIKSFSSNNKILDSIDEGIYRKNGSLRLPMNGKKPVNGRSYPLIMDDKNYTILDGLVLIYNANLYTLEGSHILGLSDMRDEYRPVEVSRQEDTTYSCPDMSIAGDAFSILDKRWDTGLSMSVDIGKFVQLRRNKPGKCPISSNIHESDNAYLLTTHTGKVLFGCHRGCKMANGSRTIDITAYGTSTEENDIMARIRHNLDKLM